MKADDRVFQAVCEYLPTHWKNCKSSLWERRADVRYYLDVPGYGQPFVDKLLARFKTELTKR